ncbi:MAG TPA: Flp pilus assembly protein CpaB, partial [Microthrixaceae bacterium]|nr:Flp pilus assembly protein CpaB [Microthrixaceae bacterium]
MSSRRTLILIGAVVIGALAAFLTLSYVRGVENRSDEAGQMVEVVVATGPIAKGSSSDAAIQGQQLAMEKRRREDLPANPVRRFADIQGQVAAVDLGGGEVITASMFVPATALNGSKSASLDKGNVAITITVDEAAGVAGLVQPGDNINILANYCGVATGGGAEGESDTCSLQRQNTPAGGGAVQLGTPSSYLFQGVKVLAVGQSLGQPVVIENRPGAGGTIAAAAVAKGEADGHTVLVPSSGHAVNPSIYPTLPYDTLKDLTGVTPLVAMPNVLVVSPSRGWKSVADLVAAAKAKPGALNYASAGVGSATHFNAEKF